MTILHVRVRDDRVELHTVADNGGRLMMTLSLEQADRIAQSILQRDQAMVYTYKSPDLPVTEEV